MAAKDKEPRDKDREAEEKRQQDVIDAVHDATHDSKGNPIPIVVEIPQSAGTRTFGGKP